MNKATRRLLVPTALLSCATLVLPLQATNYSWTGLGADNNWATAANWGGTAPVSSAANNLIFSGTTQQSSSNNINGLAQGWITLSNGGFNLGGNQLTLSPAGTGMVTNLLGTNILALPLNLTLNGKLWAISPGSEVSLTGVMTNSFGNSGTPGWLYLTNGGTLRIKGSMQGFRGMDLFQGTVIVDGGFVDQFNDGVRFRGLAGQTNTAILTNNGTWRMGSGGNYRLGVNASANVSQTIIESGTLEMYGSSAGNGRIDVGVGAGAPSVFTQNGGTVGGAGTGTGAIISIGAGASADGTYNLNGGVLWVGQVRQGNAGAANVVFNFNGGTLKPWVASTTFLQGLLTANVQNGGAIIDTTNVDITIAQNLQAAGTGGLTKRGSGTLTLSGSSSYTGATVVSNGTLAVASTSLTGGGAVIVGNGATLKVSDAGSSLATSSLNAGGGGASTLIFNLPNGNPVAAPIAATSLVGNGNVTINITGANFVPGSFTLISFSSSTGLGSYHLGTLPGGVSATLVTNATSISLNISSVVKSLAWSGAVNNQWNTSSLNWSDLNNGNNATNYAQSGGIGDVVVFNDGGANPAVNVTLAVTPVSLTVNNSSVAYSFSGSGKISGAGGIAKSGSQPLTLGTANDYTGGTVWTAGNLFIGNDQALGQGSLLVDGTGIELASDSVTSRTITNPVAMTANAAWTFLGDSVNTGILVLNGPVDFGGLTTRQLTVLSEVVLGGDISNTGGGGFSTLNGLGKLVIKGHGQIGSVGTVVTHSSSDVIIDSGSLKIGDGWRISASGVPSLTLAITNGGTLIMTNSPTANVRVGFAGGDAGANNTLDIAGTVLLVGTGGSGAVVMGGSGAADILNLRSGGTLTCSAVSQNGATATTVNFYGGTLVPISSNPTFLQGLGAANVWDGLTVDTANQNVTIGQSLLAAGAGGVTKVGAGTLTLSGTNTYAGLTTVNGGKLVFGSAHAGTGAITVASNATLALLSGTPGFTLPVSSVTNVNGSSLEAQFSGLSSNPTAPAGFITNLVVNGTVGVNLVGGNIKIGTFPLFGYGTLSGAGSLVAGQLPQGIVAVVTTNTGTKTINLVVSSVTAAIWTGAVSGNWDTTTTNWTLSGVPTVYGQGDIVRFDDTANNSFVTMSLALTPSGVTVSNSALSYQFSGSGSLGGAMGLVKQGTNTLNLGGVNSFTGDVVVQAGVLELANADALGSTLGSTYVSNGATLNMKDIRLGTRLEAVNIVGQGYGNLGALYSDTGTANGDFLRDLRLTGDAWVGAGAGARFGFTDPSATLTCVGGPYRFTKVGAGIFDLEDATVTLGEIEVKEGVLQAANTTTINSGYGLVLQGGTEFRLFNLLSPLTRPVTVSNALVNVPSGTANQFSSSVALNADGTFQIGAGFALTVAGNMTGSGRLIKTSPGLLTLQGINSYSGNTVVSNGTLTLASTASLSASSEIAVASSSAILDVSPLSPWPLGVAQTLSGVGSVNGSVLANGTVAPGATIGVLTFNNDLTLAGTNVMELSRDGGLTNDTITVVGTLQYGGRLNVVLSGSTPLVVNDTFKLFNFPSAPSGTFAAITLPAGYSWDTTQLSVDGTIRVTAVINVAPPVITQVSQVGGSLVFSGTNGISSGSYVVLGSTNITLPIVNWTPLATNSFDASGNFSVTNAIDGTKKAMFYRLMQ